MSQARACTSLGSRMHTKKTLKMMWHPPYMQQKHRIDR